MSGDQGLKTALVALGAIGLGLAGYVALSSRDKRKKFKEALRATLEEQQIGFVSADLARGASNAPIWHVTIDHPSMGIQRYYADFPLDTEPYSADTLNALLDRLFVAISDASGQQ